jgi:hypothetical protein
MEHPPTDLNNLQALMFLLGWSIAPNSEGSEWVTMNQPRGTTHVVEGIEVAFVTFRLCPSLSPSQPEAVVVHGETHSTHRTKRTWHRVVVRLTPEDAAKIVLSVKRRQTTQGEKRG